MSAPAVADLSRVAGEHKVIPMPGVDQHHHKDDAFVPPTGDLPKTADAPTPDAKIEENKKKLEEQPHFLSRALKYVVDTLDYVSNNGVKLAGFPLFWLGSALLIFGTGAAIFVLASTLSIDAVLVGPALAALMLGGLLRELGRAMREGTDLSTALGNILYVPLRYLIRLSV